MPYIARKRFFTGLGQDLPTIEPGTVYGPPTPDTDIVTESGCPSGTTLVGGVCKGSSSFATWLGTGNNALYLGGGALGFFLLLRMVKR